MFHTIQQNRFGFAVRLLSAVLVFSFLSTTILPPGYAQSIGLPLPGAMVSVSPAFVPVLLKGMTVHPDNPLQFDFIIDSGNAEYDQQDITAESQRLVKYFLASMTVPHNDLWVNLSPYEKDRIIPEELGKTELGRDLLAQDYILKQLTATLVYPENELGKKFWDRIHKAAKERYGLESVPTDVFNKVWILPETAVVYEHKNTVYIVDTHLKVMLDEDYIALQKSRQSEADGTSIQGAPDVSKSDELSQISKDMIRELILPEIEKEVNQGKNFAPLRQIYHSLILAKWYKQTVKNSLMSQVYIDRNKTAGIEIDDEGMKERIYEQYMDAYKQGVFNYIKEDYDELSQTVIPRQYFSGGFQDAAIEIGTTASAAQVRSSVVGKNLKLALEVRPETGAATNASVVEDETPKENPAEKLAQELASVENLVAQMVSEGYDEHDIRLIIDEHWKRLRQREPIDMRQDKWLERMELSVQWWMKFRKDYDHQLVNIFGPTEQQKQENVAKAAKEFREILEKDVAETGNKFFIYSGGSGVGKSTIWSALKKTPEGKKFKKFLMYHTRERRPDEDPEFQEDLVLDTMDPSLASAITLILKEEVDVLSAINVDNVSAFKDRLLQRLASDGVSLSDSARASLDKILDLNSLGENGRRIDRSLKNIQNGQDERISLAERIGRTKKGKIRIYGEFDGVQYYFTDEVSLKNGDEGDVIILPYGSVPQAVSFKGIQDILKSQSDDIFVLETTPENVEKIKNKFPQIKSIFVSPFKTVAVVGASGFAGQRIYSALRQGNSVAVIGTSFSAETPDFQRLDVTKEDEIKKFIAETRPDVIVYAAGEADPQEADKDPQAAEYLNAGAVNAFRKYFNGHFVYLSSDYVFDGKKETPYEASDSPSPINFYGQTKQRGEDAVRQFEQHSIIRSGMLFGRNTPDDRSNFVTETVQKIERGEPVEADDTQIRYPLSIYDLAEAVKTVISNETYGTSQINGAEGLTKKEFAQRIQQIYIEEASKDQTASSQKTVPILASRSASQITVPANAHMKNSFSVSGVDEGLRRTVRSVSNKLKGGSTNNLKMIKTDFGQRRVRKESPSGSWGRDKKKFTAQVQWLLGLPAQLRPFFSRVVRHNLEVHYKGEKDNELLDAVSTKTGRPSGLFVTRGSAHKNGTAHRVVHVVIYNRSTGKILIQKRAQRPDVNAPGQKDFFGGHVGASAEEDLVAIKEISQEVKLNPGEYELIKVGEGLRSIGSKDQKADDYIDEEGIFHYQSQQENNEYAALYVAVTDVPAEEINRRIKKTQATAATAENLEVEGVINVSPEDLAAEAADVQAKTAYASPVRAYFANGDVRSIILNLAQNIPGTSVDTKGEQQPYYEMPFYEGRTLTQSIIYDQQNADFIINRLKEVLSFWREHMLGARTAPVPEMYLKEVLIDRVRESLEQVKRQAPEVFQSVIEAEYIVINGKRHRNVLPLLLELEQNPELLKRLAPPALRLTHGDFHFDNMFFREDGGFVLLDPRGDYVGDPVYDLAKIAHTVIGKYDLLNYDLEKTTRQENPDGTVSITVEFPEDSHAWQVYQELERRFPALAEEFFGSSEFAKNDPYWQQRLSASLAKIMANLPIYHLKNDGKEERALALYAEGVVFFNELFDSLESIETKPAAGEATNAATLSETEAEELIQQNIRPEYHSLITRDNILRVIELSEQGYDFDIVHQNERIEGGRKVKIGELTTGWGWYGSSLTQYNLLIDSEGNEYGRGDPREDETVESWIVIGDGYAIVGRENLAYTPEKIEIIRKEKTETNASILSGPWTLSGARKRLKNVNFIESKESAKGVIRAIHLIGKQKEHTNDDINLLKKILAAVIDDAYVNDIENTIKQYLTNQQLVDAYIEALGSSQSSVVAQARIKLVELSDAKAIEPLLKALAKHPSPETESAIKKLGASNEQLVDAYIQMLQSIWVSQASIRLGELGDTKAIEPLLKALIEYASPETESALKKLGVSNEQLVDAYIQALPSDRTAQTSIRLGELGDTKAIEPLLKALAQHALPETETVLKKIGATNEQLVDAYIQALQFTNYQDYQRIRKASTKLEEFGDERAIEPLLKSLARHALPETESALKKLGATNEQLVDVYIEGLESGWVAQASIKLGELGDTKAIEPLLKALVRGVPETETALKKFGVTDEQLLNVYLKIVPLDIIKAYEEASAIWGEASHMGYDAFYVQGVSQAFDEMESILAEYPGVQEALKVYNRNQKTNAAILSGPVGLMGAMHGGLFAAFNGSLLAAIERKELPGMIIFFGAPLIAAAIMIIYQSPGGFKGMAIKAWPWTLKWARNFLDYDYNENPSAIKKAIRAIHIIGNHWKTDDEDVTRLQEAIERTPGILEELKDARAIKPLLIVLSRTASSDIETTLKRIGATNQQLTDAYIKALASSDSSVVAQASVSLGEVGDARAIQPLLTVLSKYRLEKTETALRKLGATNQQLTDAYIKALSSDVSLAVTRVSERLGEIGDARAVQPLLTVLSKYGLKKTETALRKLGATNQQLTDAYIKGLSSYTSSQAAQASKSLGEIEDTRAVQPLLTLLSKYGLAETETALKKLDATKEQLADAYLVYHYAQSLKSSDLPTINEAIKNLSELGDIRALEPLITLAQQSANILVVDALWSIGLKNPDAGILESGRISARIINEIKTGLKRTRDSNHEPIEPTEPAEPVIEYEYRTVYGDSMLLPVDGTWISQKDIDYGEDLEKFEREKREYLGELARFEAWNRNWDAKSSLLIQKLETPRPMPETNSSVNNEKDVGGIDMNTIDIDRQGGEGEGIQFDMTGMEPLLNMDIQGFTPVIIDITPINSVLPILGLADPREPAIKFGTEEAQESLQLSRVDS